MPARIPSSASDSRLRARFMSNVGLTVLRPDIFDVPVHGRKIGSPETSLGKDILLLRLPFIIWPFKEFNGKIHQLGSVITIQY